MNPFVNYQQRAIELPAGCKDLIDALRNRRKGPTTARILSEGFDGIQSYLSRMLRSKTKDTHLIISAPAAPCAIVVEFGPFLVGYRPSGLSALVYVDATEPLLEQTVRSVFEEAGFCPFAEFGVGGGVEPMRMLRYPLPDVATVAARLIADLFHKGFSVNEDAGLAFDYYEREKP